MGRLGPMEIAVILAVALLIFGPGKLADLGKGLGEGIRNFKSSMSDNPKEETTANASTSTAPAAEAEKKS